MKKLFASTAVAAAIVAGGATAAHANTSAHYLGYGYTNNAHGVWCVQSILNHTDKAGLTLDSDFGYDTEGAVEDFQTEHHLSPDGVVGPKTGNALLNAFATYQHTTVWNAYCRQYIPTTV